MEDDDDGPLLPSPGQKVPWIERPSKREEEEQRKSSWVDPWFPGCGREPIRKRGVAERYSLYVDDVRNSLSYRVMQLLSQCKDFNEEKSIIERYWKKCFPLYPEVHWPLAMKWRRQHTTKNLILAMIVASKNGITKKSEIHAYITGTLANWEETGIELHG